MRTSSIRNQARPVSSELGIPLASIGSVDWVVTCVGTGGPLAPNNRLPACTAITIGKEQVLVNCGDGMTRVLAEQRLLRPSVVFISSLSWEMWAGLPSLAQHFRFQKLSLPLQVHGPGGLRARLEPVMEAAQLPDLMEITEHADRTVLHTASGVEIEATFPTGPGDHVGLVLSFFEGLRPGKIDIARAEHHGLIGPDLAAIQAGRPVRGIKPAEVMGNPRPGRRVAVVGLTPASPTVHEALSDADVAVVSAPFMDDRLDLARSLGAMTGWEAAGAADRSGVRMLLLSQLSSHSSPGPYRREAEDEVQGERLRIQVPRDGDSVVIPMPDKGHPVFRKATPPHGLQSKHGPQTAKAHPS